MELPTAWLLAFLGSICAFIIAAANGKSGLSKRIETEVSRMLPKNASLLTARYAGMLVIGVFSAAYTLFIIQPVDFPNVFGGSIAAAAAIETFPGSPKNHEDDSGSPKNHEDDS